MKKIFFILFLLPVFPFAQDRAEMITAQEIDDQAELICQDKDVNEVVVYVSVDNYTYIYTYICSHGMSYIKTIEPNGMTCGLTRSKDAPFSKELYDLLIKEINKK